MEVAPSYMPYMAYMAYRLIWLLWLLLIIMANIAIMAGYALCNVHYARTRYHILTALVIKMSKAFQTIWKEKEWTSLQPKSTNVPPVPGYHKLPRSHQ